MFMKASAFFETFRPLQTLYGQNLNKEGKAWKTKSERETAAACWD